MQEIVPIQDIVCSGLGRVERLSGGLLRFWLYIEQDDGEGAGNIVVAKIIAPVSAVPSAVLQMIEAIGVEVTSLLPGGRAMN